MGIPSYFSYIVKNHPEIIQKYYNSSFIVSNFYLDCNSIIYDSYAKLDPSILNENAGIEIINSVIFKIEEYIQLIQPKQRTIIAFDGVAPLAKLKQQRERRFKSWFQADATNNISIQSHIWDKTDFLLSYSDYINKLNEEKRIYRFKELFNYNRPLYNLLNYFLFIPNTPIKQGVPIYGWNNEELKDLKIGWQFPNEVLKKWSIENFDEQTKLENKKYPMDMIVPIDLKPSIRIKNKEINSFEDVVNIFKTEIQFRNDEDNLFKEVDFLIKKHKLTNSDSSIEKLKKLHFYTYTKGVISAIDSIFRSFVKNNESFKDVSFEVKSQENCIEFQIIHLNSFPSKKMELEKPNKFFSGDSNAIINHLFSLCDYSIISKFNNESNFEVAILFDDVFGTPDGNNLKKLDTPMKLYELKGLEVRGFSHKFKFYV
jgi:hypothetical protein